MHLNRISELELTDLALSAAMNDFDTAIRSWQELIERQEFAQFGSDISRIVPAIYANIGRDSSLREIARLRGVGKRTWSHNQKAVGAVAEALNELGAVNYRILKGAALLLLSGNFASRSMGDIDLLISREDIEQVCNALDQSGFRNEFQSFCLHREAYFNSPELNFVNESGVQIDLHILEEHDQKELFSAMLKDAATELKYRGVTLKIPRPELLYVHAIIHGMKNVAAGDTLQSQIDTYFLSPYVDSSVLKELWEQYGLSRLTNHQSHWPKKISPPRVNVQRIFQKVYAVVRSRGLSRKIAWKASADIGMRRPIYFFWLLLGKPRGLEVFVSRYMNGFLPGLKERNTKMNVLAQEIRFKLESENKGFLRRLVFTGEALTNTSFLLFQDGYLRTTIGGKGHSDWEEIIHVKRNTSEFSIRLTRTSCGTCANKYGDTKFMQQAITIQG